MASPVTLRQDMFMQTAEGIFKCQIYNEGEGHLFHHGFCVRKPFGFGIPYVLGVIPSQAKNITRDFVKDQ